MNTIAHGPEWLEWLAEQVGTHQWCVAARLSPRLKAKGYTLALTQARYTALQDAYNALQATAKAEALLADLRSAAGEACALLGSGSSTRDREAEARLKTAINTLAERLSAEL